MAFPKWQIAQHPREPHLKYKKKAYSREQDAIKRGGKPNSGIEQGERQHWQEQRRCMLVLAFSTKVEVKYSCQFLRKLRCPF